MDILMTTLITIGGVLIQALGFGAVMFMLIGFGAVWRRINRRHHITPPDSPLNRRRVHEFL